MLLYSLQIVVCRGHIWLRVIADISANSHVLCVLSPHWHADTAYWPEDSRLPLLPLMILPLLPILASLEVFRVPVSVRSMAISLKLRAAWIFDWWRIDRVDLSVLIIKQFNCNILLAAFAEPCLWLSPDLALLAVQVELVLADCHGPDRLDECRTGVPRVHSNATVTKCPPRHRRPTVGADTKPPYIHWM